MADPVMSNLPLRKVLDCVSRDWQTRDEIVKAYSLRNPMEAWIRFSNAMRRKVFNEKKENDVAEFLQDLVHKGYVELHVSRVHPHSSVTVSKLTPFYRLTEKGKAAKLSVKRA